MTELWSYHLLCLDFSHLRLVIKTTSAELFICHPFVLFAHSHSQPRRPLSLLDVIDIHSDYNPAPLKISLFPQFWSVASHSLLRPKNDRKLRLGWGGTFVTLTSHNDWRLNQWQHSVSALKVSPSEHPSPHGCQPGCVLGCKLTLCYHDSRNFSPNDTSPQLLGVPSSPQGSTTPPNCVHGQSRGV